MRIMELLAEGNLPLQLSAALKQIAGRVIDTGSDSPVNISVILTLLGDLGINLDEAQFREMVESPPLNNIIASVEGDNVIFLGQRRDTNDAVKPDQSTATLEKMAKRAAQKRD